MAGLEELALKPLVAPVGFSVTSRLISVAISGLIGGRPIRCGWVHVRVTRRTSMSFDADERPRRSTQPQTRTKIR